MYIVPLDASLEEGEKGDSFTTCVFSHREGLCVPYIISLLERDAGMGKWSSRVVEDPDNFCF